MTKPENNVDLLYLAKPSYGGWVTFTAHLFHCLKEKKIPTRLFKMGNKTEKKYRPYGYNVPYLNIDTKAIGSLKNKIITAIDKNHYQFIPHLVGSKLVIHDPTELTKELVPYLKSFKIITIRKTVQEHLRSVYGIDSHLVMHPFFQYAKKHSGEKKGAVSISRVDFDKHTEVILEANKILKDPIDIYGAVNRLYEHFKLEGYDFRKYYKGTFLKNFDSVSYILSKNKFMVDMSAIKNDGAGTQYTFLEAIHSDCALILSSKWFENGAEDVDIKRINAEAYKILSNHAVKIGDWL